MQVGEAHLHEAVDTTANTPRSLSKHQRHVLCSNTRTSLNTLNLSTLSVLTEYTEYADVSVFQIEYSAVH